jgi:predicted nucleic acid-binding protein
VVVDASIAVQWLAPEPGSGQAMRLLESQSMLLAPDFLPLEVASALCKKERRGEMTLTQVEQALTNLGTAGLILTSTTPLLVRATRLACETRHSVYDCVYLVMAREWNARLASADVSLLRIGERLQLTAWRP